MSTTTANVIVAGTGPAGLMAALAFSQAGFDVDLIGPPPSRGDGRTTALMTPALAFLEKLGLLDAIRPQSAPLRVMRIVDATSRLVRSPVVTFRASEIGEEMFGLNIPNAVLNSGLEEAVAASTAISWHRTMVDAWDLAPEAAQATLSGGTVLAAPLVVAADGRQSPARKAAGIESIAHPYKQSALVLSFGHSRVHNFISTEFHTETGPFTQVPLPGDRSSLVWVVSPKQAQDLMALDDAELSRRVEDKMQSMLGRVTVEPGRQVYPLGATLPKRFAAKRVALVGEAAHVFPPIGAQGLNLGIRDVIDLVDSATKNLADDPGSESTLDGYDSKRRPDILARSGAVNLLNRSLLSDMLPAQLARGAGLSLLGGFAPLRAFFMREGLRPGSGFRAALSDLREQVRR